MKECWQQDPTKRPKATKILETITQQMDELPAMEGLDVETPTQKRNEIFTQARDETPTQQMDALLIQAPDSDTVGQLLQKQKYDEAYGVSRKRIKLDPAVIRCKDLVDHYRCCMLVGETEEAIQIKEQLKILFKEKFQTTPNEFKTFADTIRGEGRNMEAILFYQIAAEFYGNQSKVDLAGIKNCATGIQKSIKAMLSRDKELKPLVRTHVIPLMRYMREMIQRSDDVSEEERCLQEVECLCQIGVSEYLVGDFDSVEKTLKEAIAFMQRVFKEKAVKYKVYGHCLHNLGLTYYNTSRPNEACECYRKAIAAYGKAEDINDDEKSEEIGICRRNLESVAASSLQHENNTRQEHMTHTWLVEQPSVSQATSLLQEVQVEEMIQEVDDVGLEHQGLHGIEPNKYLFKSSSKWIGPSGGKLEVGGCELVVPPGALEEDVEIKLTASLPLESEFLETPTLQCEPASLTFKEQVTIKLQTHVVLDKETDLGCKLLHSDDGINWEPTKTEFRFGDNFISFETNHFSWWTFLFGEPAEVTLYTLLYDNAGAVVWDVCWNLDLVTKGNDSEKFKFSDATWKIKTGNDLNLSIETCDTNEEVEIWPSEKTIPADQINTKCRFGNRFEVIRKSSNRIKLEAKANCGNFKWEPKIYFPLPRKQVADHQPVPQNVNIIGSDIKDGAAVLSTNVQIQQSPSSPKS